MSPEENKALVRSFWDELYLKGNLGVIDQFVAPDVIDHNPLPGQGPGVEGVKQLFALFRQAFPDAQVSVEDIIAEGDKVVIRTSVCATHSGAFMGISPTGKTVSTSGIEIIRIAGGKMVERWGAADDLGLMQQMGGVQAPGQSRR